ncbi:helix-turn-helix transcriptional regulator [soil metagenome]
MSVIPTFSTETAIMVRYFRKQSGLSQQQLAQLAGVGKTVVFDIEKGKTTVQIDSLLKILDVLNIKFKFETPFVRPKEEDKT